MSIILIVRLIPTSFGTAFKCLPDRVPLQLMELFLQQQFAADFHLQQQAMASQL